MSMSLVNDLVRIPVNPDKKKEVNYIDNNHNYDERRKQSNVPINPKTNGSGGANVRVGFEGNNNDLGKIKL